MLPAQILIGVSEYTGARRYPDRQIYNLVGKWPKILRWEFEPINENATANAVGIAMLQDHAGKGGICSIHDHQNNPVTGGDVKDRTGSPVAAIKPGGSHYGLWLQYLDKIATAVKAINGQVIYRPFHEMNAWSETAGFWWAGPDRRDDLLVVWRDMVRYLRDVKGCANIAFEWCPAIQDNAGQTWSDPVLNPYESWWPGAEYVDIVSCTLYSHRVPYSVQAATFDAWKSLKKIADKYVKPIGISEIGVDVAQTQAGVWSLVFDMVRNLPGCGFVCFWNLNVCPAIGNEASASAQAELSKPDCVWL